MAVAEWAGVFCAATTALQLVTNGIAAVRLRRARGESPPRDAAVTVLRPVCGTEPLATETLGSSFTLHWPQYEVIFCAARCDDPVVPIVRELIVRHPEVPARLLFGKSDLGSNPKLNNIAKGWSAARHRWILVADSNVLLPPDAIERMLARWGSDTGAVCSMPIGARPGTFWAELECAFLNTLQARFQYVSEAVGRGFAQGKAMLFRRDIVERFGGLAALAVDAAEDAATTKVVRGLGLRVRLVDVPFEQPLGNRGAGEVWARQLRWARLRRRSFPLLFLPEILLGGAFPAAALALSGASPALFTAWLALWLTAEAVLARCSGWRFPPRMLVAVLLRDLLLPVLWAAAWRSSGYVWRGNAIELPRPSRFWPVMAGQPALAPLPAHRRQVAFAMYRARLRVLREVWRRT